MTAPSLPTNVLFTIFIATGGSYSMKVPAPLSLTVPLTMQFPSH
jgi:hypothetical protein